jgi:aspartyl protease family protein
MKDDVFSRRLGKWMVAATWLIVLGLMTLLFQQVLDNQRNPNRAISSSMSEAGIAEVQLLRNRFGHYVATGRINGSQVDFLVDTGATDVSVPIDVAERLALRRGPQFQVETANGIVTVYHTILDSVELGEVSLYNVRANINPHMQGTEILLGMSFLRDVELIQRGELLIIRQYAMP